MADNEKSDFTTGAESPTTARPIELDDDEQETGVVQPDGTSTPTRKPQHPTRTDSRLRAQEGQDDQEAPPAKPPRPLSPNTQAENTLIEAFPSIDTKVIKAVLVASHGQVEPAFNALLGMSDPDFQEEAPPPRPPRPAAAPKTQLEQDELYARQLAQHYQTQDSGLAYGEQRYDERNLPRDPRRAPRSPTAEEDKDYNFFDDELPEIRENIRQGFLQTQSKVNKWISDFKKRIDGDTAEEIDADLPPTQPPRQNFGPSAADQQRGIQRTAGSLRREHGRYDSDPRVLSDNLTELELRDEEADGPPPPKPPRKQQRPLANPDLFKPTPPAPQQGPVDEVENLYGHPDMPPASKESGAKAGADAGTAKSKKWQPLTALSPTPAGDDDDDNDPFAIGDNSDDEKKTDLKKDDTDRLKRAATSVTVDPETAAATRASLQEQERSDSGTRNKEAEELMK